MKTENLSHQFSGEASPRKIEKVCQSLIEGLKARNATATRNVLDGYESYEFEGVTLGIRKSEGATTIAIEYVCS